MDTKQILTDLRAELNRIEYAISALESLDGTGRPSVTAPSGPPAPAKARGRRTMSAAGRKRISEMMKARWAQRRKKAAPAKKTTAAKKAAPARHMSSASRKKIAEAQRKRWAAQKKTTAKKAVKRAVPPRVRATRASKSASPAPEPTLTGLLKNMLG